LAVRDSLVLDAVDEAGGYPPPVVQALLNSLKSQSLVIDHRSPALLAVWGLVLFGGLGHDAGIEPIHL
jgi:hypothetical protein